MFTLEVQGWRAIGLLFCTFIGMVDMMTGLGIGIYLLVKHFT